MPTYEETQLQSLRDIISAGASQGYTREEIYGMLMVSGITPELANQLLDPYFPSVDTNYPPSSPTPTETYAPTTIPAPMAGTTQSPLSRLDPTDPSTWGLNYPETSEHPWNIRNEESAVTGQSIVNPIPDNTVKVGTEGTTTSTQRETKYINGVYWVNVNGKQLSYDPSDPLNSDLTKEQYAYLSGGGDVKAILPEDKTMSDYEKAVIERQRLADETEQARWEAEQATIKQNAENTNIFNARTLMADELDKLQTLQQTPRSWIEYSERGAQLANSPWWAPTMQQATTTPSNGGVEQQGLIDMLKTLASKLIPAAGGTGIPNTPDWLANMAEVPAQSGQPLSGASWKLPSAQQYGGWSDTQREMFKGYSDWTGPGKTGNQWADVQNRLNKLWPTWAAPKTARYGAAYQR